jgi:serine/threonine-protein kinase
LPAREKAAQRSLRGVAVRAIRTSTRGADLPNEPTITNTTRTSAPEITVVQTVESEARRTTIVALGVLLLLAIGLATYFGVKSALRELRGDGLQALRDAQVNALNLWVGSRIGAAESWASESELRDAVARLIALARQDRVAEGCASADVERVLAALRPSLHEKGFNAFAVVDRNGTVIAAHDAETCGKRLNPGPFLSRLDQVFSGRPAFIRPHLEQERFVGMPQRRLAEPFVWFDVPVRDRAGRTIAVLSFGEPARLQFAQLFRPAGLGQTDEVYAFTPEGMVLSELRHLDKLRDAQVLRDASLARSTLNLEVRDPGGDLLEGFHPDVQSAAQPLTRLASVAIAAQKKTAAAELQGVLVDAYRNYRGASVIGAWRWLPDYQIAVAVEIERDEAYAPLNTIERAFALVLGLSIAAGVGVLISVLSAMRERRRFGAVRRLGRYTLLEKIGEGGSASVYRGRHELLKRAIAIKILSRQATDELVARFEREVQLASRLGHPNTVEIYDYGRTGAGDFYYVMEYLDGVTLAKLVARDGALPVGRVVYFMRQITSALKGAHTSGLVHRDIKPENIMACVRGGEHDVIKILDFGLVKSIDEVDTREITRSVLRVLGTPVYMSPERFDNPAASDVRTDLYALGAVAYLMLTGKRLFEGASGEELQQQIRYIVPPRPSVLRGEPLPPSLDDLVMACLAKQPADRPDSADEVLDRLREIALDLPWLHRDAAAWWEAYKSDRPPREAAARAPAAVVR